MLQTRMVRLTLAVFLVSSVSVGYCNAGDDQPIDLVKRSVKYLGGAKNLKKYKALSFTEEGVFYGDGEGMEYTGKYSSLGTSKMRMEIVGVFTQVFDGKKGWMQQGGQTIDMNDDQIKAMKSQMYAGMVMQLYPIVGKKFTLSFDGEEKVDGKKAVIVKVMKKGHKDVRLFFDPKTAALVKAEYTAPMDGMPGKNVKYTTIYSDYKSDGKIKYASQYLMTRDGKKFLKSKIISFKSAEKLPPKTFVKPD